MFQPAVGGGDAGVQKTQEEWSTLLVACGLCTIRKEHILPSWLLSKEMVDKLDVYFDTSTLFRRDVAALSTLDPPSAIGDLNRWLESRLPDLLPYIEESAAPLLAPGSELPGTIPFQFEATEMNLLNFMSGLMVDAPNYAAENPTRQEPRVTDESMGRFEDEQHPGCEEVPEGDASK
jgi:hypothetical protein